MLKVVRVAFHLLTRIPEVNNGIRLVSGVSLPNVHLGLQPMNLEMVIARLLRPRIALQCSRRIEVLVHGDRSRRHAIARCLLHLQR